MLDPDINDRLASLSGANVQIEVLSPTRAWSLRARGKDSAAIAAAWQAPLPQDPLSVAIQGDRQAIFLGPDEWLLLSSRADAAKGIADLADIIALSLVEISDRELGWRISGPDARKLLATGCPLDLDERAFPAWRGTRTVFAHAEIMLWRGDDPSVWHVRALRSFADYLVRHWAASIDQLRIE